MTDKIYNYYDYLNDHIEQYANSIYAATPTPVTIVKTGIVVQNIAIEEYASIYLGYSF